MSDAADALRRLTSQVDEAVAALRRAQFSELADLAARIEQAESAWRARCDDIRGDAAAEAECRRLRSSLDCLGGLLGHIAGVQRALRALDPARATVYGPDGAGVSGGRARVREEA